MYHYLYAFPESLSALEGVSPSSSKAQPGGLRYYEMLNCITQISGHKVVADNLMKHMSLYYCKGLLSLGDYFHLSSDNFGFLICCKDGYEVDKDFFKKALYQALIDLPKDTKEVRVVIPLSKDSVETILELSEVMSELQQDLMPQSGLLLFGVKGFQRSCGLASLDSEGEVIN